jgi:hypothetical protein
VGFYEKQLLWSAKNVKQTNKVFFVISSIFLPKLKLRDSQTRQQSLFFGFSFDLKKTEKPKNRKTEIQVAPVTRFWKAIMKKISIFFVLVFKARSVITNHCVIYL